MNTIKPIETLIYCDGSDLFIGRDAADARYICMRYENSESDKYLCTAISRKRESEFRHGSIDLLSIFKSSETGKLFYLECNGLPADPVAIFEIDANAISEDMLPSPGFYLDEAFEEQKIVKEAIERNRAIIYFSLNAPESYGETKIDTRKLVEFLQLFQTSLKFAFKNSIANFSKELRVKIYQYDNFGTEVFSFEPGSFTVCLQSKSTADLLGYVDIEKALQKFGEIVSVVGNPEAAIDALNKNKGHLAKSFRKLLTLIIENNTPVKYTWIIPQSEKPNTLSISKDEAIPILQLMNERMELDIEERILTGRIIKADFKNGYWSLQDPDSKREYHGRIHPSYDISLSGIVIQNKIYKLKCEEKIEQETVSQKEIVTYYLTEITES